MRAKRWTKWVMALGVLSLAGCERSATARTTQAVSAAGPKSVDDSLSTRAERGLELSPVPVRTAGLSAAQVKEIGYGSYLLNTSICTGCHSTPAGFLAGGNPFPLDDAGHIVWSRNLTPDPATGLTLTEDQFMAAMREGQDFHAGASGMLVVMPWLYFRWMSDADLHAIYAYLRAIPPVRNVVAPDNKAGLGLPPSIPFPGRYDDGEVDRTLPVHDTPLAVRRGLAIQPLARANVPPGDLKAFGRGSYLVNAVIGCSDCHTNPARSGPKINTDAYLTGGQVFADPPPLRPLNHQVRSMSQDLLGATHGFMNEPDMRFETFSDILTTLTHADDTPPTPLAWPMSEVGAGKLLPEDLHAIWVYLRHLPGNTATDKETQHVVTFCATSADCGAGESCALNPASGANECVGQKCSADADCGACDACVSGACQPLPPGDACYTNGI